MLSFGAGCFVLLGDPIGGDEPAHDSDDGATWSDGTAPGSNLDMANWGIAFHPTVGFLRVSDQYGQGGIWASAHGMTWTDVGGTLGGYWLTGVRAVHAGPTPFGSAIPVYPRPGACLGQWHWG